MDQLPRSPFIVFSPRFPVFHIGTNEATALVGVGTDNVVVQVITL